MSQKSTMLTQEQTQDLFPSIFDADELIEDNNLPPLTLINADIIENKAEILIQFYYIRKSDIFLYHNHHRVDMYYQSAPGVYRFNCSEIDKGNNQFELFYRVGNRKSTSLKFILKG